MMKIDNKSIFLSFIVIAMAALAFMALVPELASAEGGRNVFYGQTDREFWREVERNTDRGDSRVSSLGAYNAPAGYNTYTTYSFPPDDGIYGGVSRSAVSSGTTRVSTEPVDDAEENNEFSELAANAIFGGATFLPSGITQWIIFLIFVLLIVIIVRRITGASDRYHQAPLKHD